VIAYQVLKDGSVYQERGGSYFDQLHPERSRNRLLRRLERLGWDVTITPRTPQRPTANSFTAFGLRPLVFEGTRTKLQKGAANLPKPSVVNVSRILTVDKAELTERIGELPQFTIDAIRVGLNLLFGRV